MPKQQQEIRLLFESTHWYENTASATTHTAAKHVQVVFINAPSFLGLVILRFLYVLWCSKNIAVLYIIGRWRREKLKYLAVITQKFLATFFSIFQPRHPNPKHAHTRFYTFFVRRSRLIVSVRPYTRLNSRTARQILMKFGMDFMLLKATRKWSISYSR
jgi:hypothetical protein